MTMVGNRTLLILLLGGLLYASCSREAGTPARRTDRIVRTASDWGLETEGVQCRLRPTKRLWQSGEMPSFRLDLHNHGRRLFAFDALEPIRPDRIWLDGRWYRWRREETTPAKIRPLAPGANLADLTLTVPAEMGLPLAPGRHTIQVAFDLEDLTVLSNPVGIEIAAGTP